MVKGSRRVIRVRTGYYVGVFVTMVDTNLLGEELLAFVLNESTCFELIVSVVRA